MEARRIEGTAGVTGEAAAAGAAERERLRRAARALARLMDSSIPIPGTTFRIGLDPILGLAPGVGDLVTAGASVYLIWIATRLGAPKHVRARMVAILAADVAAGAVPVLGDLFDAGFKANMRILRLMEKHGLLEEERPGAVR